MSRLAVREEALALLNESRNGARTIVAKYVYFMVKMPFTSGKDGGGRNRIAWELRRDRSLE